ncbi:MAG: DUF4149 domain-containing protein [Deltaproteobacteria bacterium]|nr:DUF4149 domain-containing protein [Deltaproteobacteria bacterium]
MYLNIFLYVYLICLSIFFGSSIFIGYIAAPYIFKTLNSRNEAGNMVGALLHKFSTLGYITQVLMVIAGYILYLNRVTVLSIFILPLIILILLLFSENFVSRKMNGLKKQMGSIDETPKDDTKRKQFNSLHKWSVKLFLLNELLCLPLFYFILMK